MHGAYKEPPPFKLLESGDSGTNMNEIIIKMENERERRAIETLLSLHHEEADNQSDLALHAIFRRTIIPPPNKSVNVIRSTQTSPTKKIVRTQPDFSEGNETKRITHKTTLTQ